MTTELTTTEEAHLARCEADIQRGLYEAWRGLREINEGRLYRAQFATFEEYVETRWGFSRRYASRLIESANLIDEMGTNGSQISINERTVRALLEVSKTERSVVFALATKASGGNLDSGWIKDAQQAVQEQRATGGMVDDGDGGMTAAHAAITEARHERMMRQRQHINGGNSNMLLKVTANAPVRLDRRTGQLTLTIADADLDSAEALIDFIKEKKPTMRLLLYEVEQKS